MMKKALIRLTTIFIAAILLLSQTATFAFAKEELEPVTSSDIEQIIQLENGDRIEILKKQSHSFLRSSIVTVSQSTRYVDKNNKVHCIFTLLGDFSVNYGVSVRCVKTYYEFYKTENSWSFENVKLTPNNSDSTRSYTTGSGAFVQRIMGIKLSSRNVSITIDCDKYGN